MSVKVAGVVKGGVITRGPYDFAADLQAASIERKISFGTETEVICSDGFAKDRS